MTHRPTAFAMVIAVVLAAAPAAAGSLTIAAASDLKFAFGEIVESFRKNHPDDKIEVIFGSSGKMMAQIINGAPFDLYFSADIAYPRELAAKGLTAGDPVPYAIGRLVLWSPDRTIATAGLSGLPKLKELRRLAIANPEHAPYGRRAQEALERAGVWTALKPKLVLGENIAQTMKFVDSGAAEAGIVALSLVKAPTMDGRGHWTLIPADAHPPLSQAWVITRRAAANGLAAAFVRHLETDASKAVMERYGFERPEETKVR